LKALSKFRNFSILNTVSEADLIGQAHSGQFKTGRLADNGDIPLGDIPDVLKYDRPYETTTISNGIKVMTEPFQSEVTSVGVFIGAGSRHEKQENSGEAHFLEHLHFKGSARRNRY